MDTYPTGYTPDHPAKPRAIRPPNRASRLAAPLLLVLAGCSRTDAHRTPPGPARASSALTIALDPTLPGWLPRNRERIDRFLAEYGSASPRYDRAHPPVAVFDWDNTMMRNDIGDATVFWMLRHDKVRQPPARDWSQTNRHLTADALAALHAACDALAEPGQPLPTASHAPCADAIVGIYDRGHTPSGSPAWDQAETTATMHQPYAWGAQLQAGYTPDEVRGFARAAFEENSAAPVGATQTVGTTGGLNAYVRIYEPMENLVRALRSAGIEPWVISASSQYLVDVVAPRAGFAPDHVVGVRTIREPDGRAGYRIEGCGMEPDGADTVITFDQGKRCWINRAVFHRMPADQLARASDPARRPAFAAGDSDTDLAMLQDATGLKLAIDRQRTLLMCNALDNPGGHWLVQPMFIAPMPARTQPYPCASALDHAGHTLADEDGRPLPDAPPAAAAP